MTCLPDRSWKPYYSPDDCNIVEAFYVPALRCAVRYDRQAGFFSASALAVAARGIEGLVQNQGRMRLVVGHTLGAGETAAIERGESLREVIAAEVSRDRLLPPDQASADALELLAWMVAHGFLEVKVAVPCDDRRRPVPDYLFHAKSGILEDREGNRLLFSGSINETEYGWRHNIETFHVHTSWEDGARHIDPEERAFQALWVDRYPRAVTLDVPSAKRQDLLRFMPEDDLPKRLKRVEGPVPETRPEPRPRASDTAPQQDPRKTVWSFIARAPALPDRGERVGEATAAVTPWPHQVRAFERMYHHWPPRLLIADEVGLGKTIQAGLVLRQAWLAERARRILVMAPKSVLRQWQLELREKFNLNWPIYDGSKMTWTTCPALGENPSRAVSRERWHEEPCVIVSSHLMRRRERARELLEQAQPWDLIVLDEAHHARRRGGGRGSDERPNQLLRLMQRLAGRTDGLVLMTATPMQVSPKEVWDLLSLLGLPQEWDEASFERFFEMASATSPSHEEMASMARMFRAIETEYGRLDDTEAQRTAGIESAVRLSRILNALRSESTVRLRKLETHDRKLAQRLIKRNTPLRRLISRHTRRLLRRYYQAGKISTPIPTREVRDEFVELTEQERRVYTAVEKYISTTYNAAMGERRTAIGFVMTIYRRRLASSFHALAQTLQARSRALSAQQPSLIGEVDDDVFEDELVEAALDAPDADQVGDWEQESLQSEERDNIESLLRDVMRLGADSKAVHLDQTLSGLRTDGFEQVMVFTQFTDTMDFLRQYLTSHGGWTVLCYSGRGGEVLESDGWRTISRDETKRRFSRSSAEILLCTDAAAEGLNFQFCGAIVNYDMPWNPMRVEQRIGRIDRVGQQHPTIRIVNLHYQDTVETDVYIALRQRIRLFEDFVGGLQPILSTLPEAIKQVAVTSGEKQRERQALVDKIRDDVAAAG